MKIVTDHICPPVPVRDYDWCAYDADTFDGSPGSIQGFGRTEKEAIENLCEQMDVCPPGCWACAQESSPGTSSSSHK